VVPPSPVRVAIDIPYPYPMKLLFQAEL
jgi:hypothetical protein